MDLNIDALKKTVEELGSNNVQYSAADVSKSAEVQGYVSAAVKVFGKIDVFLIMQELKA